LDTIFKEAHGNNEQTLVPINKFNGRFELTLGLKSFKKEVEILKEKFPHLIDDIYFIPRTRIQPFCFYKGNVWVDIYSLDMSAWDMFQQDKMIEHQLEFIGRFEKENDYENLFSFMEKKILITKYIELFDSIPDEQKYNCFRDVWTRSEYGFNLFEPSFLKEVFTFAKYSEERNDSLQQLKNSLKGKEIVTVYRGITFHSTKANEAISWTLDRSIADFFASRFDSKGKVIKAEIHINDILDYISRRNEKEVFLNPKKLINSELHYQL
jgi:hypothetical protein